MKLHTSQFEYAKNTKTFVAEASELGCTPGDMPISIALTSERTGKTAGFVLAQIEENGSLLTFEATGPTMNALGIKVQIIND